MQWSLESSHRKSDGFEPFGPVAEFFGWAMKAAVSDEVGGYCRGGVGQVVYVCVSEPGGLTGVASTVADL